MRLWREREGEGGRVEGEGGRVEGEGGSLSVDITVKQSTVRRALFPGLGSQYAPVSMSRRSKCKMKLVTVVT